VPKNLSDKIADKVTAHSIDLERAAAASAIEVSAILNDLADEIVADLSNGVKEFTPRQKKRLQALLVSTREAIRSAYRDIKSTHKNNLIDLGTIESTFAVSSLNTAVGASLVAVKHTRAQLGALVTGSLIEGAPVQDWWAKEAGDMFHRFSTQMRMGILRGETINDLVKRVTGPSGVMPITDRRAKALVRTSFQSIANAVRLDTYRQNADVIKGLQALVTLDLRTSTICQARSSSSWDMEGNPLNGTKERFPGHPPWHFNCRTTLIPITKSWKELGVKKDVEEFSIKTQQSMDGKVAGDLTYEQWLRSKPKKAQIEALGRGKWGLWTDGKLTLPQMLDQSGRRCHWRI